MKKKIYLIWVTGLALAILAAACSRQESRPETKEERKQPVKRGLFHTEILLKTTPVKNQGRSELCWAYAMLATIETEHLMHGDSVNLSVDFVARALLKEQFVERYMAESSRGDRDEISTRGIMPMLIRMIQTYGLTHYDAYHRKKDCNYRVLCRKLNQETASRLRLHGAEALQRHIDDVLDEAIGPVPRYVFMLGAEYTALEFAHSVCRADEYEALTSFTYHPFGERFPLEIPDNRYHDTFLNVPLDSLMKRMDHALRTGHPVCWEGDTSEEGFRWKDGVATLSEKKAAVGQEERQRAFESRQTTDDHCMEVVGIARDSKGTKYYIMKNSWGTGNAFKGFILMSEDYVRMKTMALMIPVL